MVGIVFVNQIAPVTLLDLGGGCSSFGDDILGQVCERFNWVIHTYCQMSNRYHMLIETPDGNLAEGMRQLNGVDTQRVNQTYNVTAFKVATRLS